MISDSGLLENDFKFGIIGKKFQIQDYWKMSSNWGLLENDFKLGLLENDLIQDFSLIKDNLM